MLTPIVLGERYQDESKELYEAALREVGGDPTKLGPPSLKYTAISGYPIRCPACDVLTEQIAVYQGCRLCGCEYKEVYTAQGVGKDSLWHIEITKQPSRLWLLLAKIRVWWPSFQQMHLFYKKRGRWCYGNSRVRDILRPWRKKK